MCSICLNVKITRAHTHTHTHTHTQQKERKRFWTARKSLLCDTWYKSVSSVLWIPLAAGFFRGRVIPVTYKLALQWLPCQAPGVTGSALRVVGPVSVYCDWVRWKVWSATSISVWQHVKLSVQIRPWDTLPCCWDIKQPTNKQTVLWNAVEQSLILGRKPQHSPGPGVLTVWKLD